MTKILTMMMMMMMMEMTTTTVMVVVRDDCDDNCAVYHDSLSNHKIFTFSEQNLQCNVLMM